MKKEHITSVIRSMSKHACANRKPLSTLALKGIKHAR